MEAIKRFINEVRRSEWVDMLPFSERMYNGIKVIQSEQSYYNSLIILYNEAVIELTTIPSEKLMVLERLIEEIEETQKCFEMPSDELLSSLMRDYESSHHQIKSLKEDYDYLIFVKGCMAIQKSFLERFKKKIISQDDSNKVNDKVENSVTANLDTQVITGVKGLARFLHKGQTTAQDIINRGILQREGVAYRVNNSWNFNAEKLSDLLAKNPDLLNHRNK